MTDEPSCSLATTWGRLAQLCEHGVFLQEGQIKMIGPVKEAIELYLKSSLDHNAAQALFRSLLPNGPSSSRWRSSTRMAVLGLSSVATRL